MLVFLRHLFDDLIKAGSIGKIDLLISLLEIAKFIKSVESSFHDFKVCNDLNFYFQFMVFKVILIYFISMRMLHSSFIFFFTTFFRIIITVKLITIFIVISAKFVLSKTFLFVILLLLFFFFVCCIKLRNNNLKYFVNIFS